MRLIIFLIIVALLVWYCLTPFLKYRAEQYEQLLKKTKK
jgi:hypothetical protein